MWCCCCDSVGGCENVCCVAAVVKRYLFLALECCICVWDVMDVFVCIVRRGAIGARALEV